nr:methyltransferase domain-containing protein [uncultured Senegalimassilia sp.]
MAGNNMPEPASSFKQTSCPHLDLATASADQTSDGRLDRIPASAGSSNPNTPDDMIGAESAIDAQPFTPKLTTTDWNAEWMALQQARRKADDPTYWDSRAHTFPTSTEPSLYARRFIELADIQHRETVFDMGCGTGALAVPLGLAGHKVVAADFSRGMLDRMSEALEQADVHTVFPMQLSWEEDWAAKGVRPGMVDVCTASRSIATANLRDSLLRLTDIARRRVCITLTTGSSPRTDERIMAELGLKDALCPDYLYAINILAAEGILPQVDFIRSERNDTFDTPEQAAESLRRMIDGAAGAVVGEQQRQAAYVRLHAWLNDNLVPNEHAGSPDGHGGVQKVLRLRNPRVITWAFIAWDK